MWRWSLFYLMPVLKELWSIFSVYYNLMLGTPYLLWVLSVQWIHVSQTSHFEACLHYANIHFTYMQTCNETQLSIMNVFNFITGIVFYFYIDLLNARCVKWMRANKQINMTCEYLFCFLFSIEQFYWWNTETLVYLFVWRSCPCSCVCSPEPNN